MKPQTKPLYEIRVDTQTYRITTLHSKAQELADEMSRRYPNSTVEIHTSACPSNEAHFSLDTLLVSATMLGLFILILASFLSVCLQF